MQRLSDPAELHRLIHLNAREAWKPSLEACERWLADPAHLALVEGNDLVMFMGAPPTLHGHVMLHSRGKQALTIARKALTHVFGLGAKEILGATPERFRDALMFARLLGFRPYGEEERPDGKVILSRLEKHNHFSRANVA